MSFINKKRSINLKSQKFHSANPTVKKPASKKITNEEGYRVYKRRVDQALFLHSVSFRPRNSFYNSIEDKLQMLVDLISKNDHTFVEALAWYNGKVLGNRLSPTIMLNELVLNEEKTRNSDDFKKINKIIEDVFTRPDFIANFLGYNKYKLNSKSALYKLPPEIIILLRKKLESFNELTLKRQRMRRRSIKLADLIKMFHPRPKNPKMSALYKAIIENRSEASLKTEIKDGKIVSSEHTTAALSTKGVSKDEKTIFLQENISKLPINSVVKNLSFLTEQDAQILKTRLTNVFESGDGLRFINPFDLILLESIEFGSFTSPEIRVNKKLVNIIDEILAKYIQFNVDCKKPVVLYDRSGSMHGECNRTGIKFISAIGKLFYENFKFYCFEHTIYDVTNYVKNIFMNSYGPNDFARKLQDFIRPNGRTRLLDSMRKVIKENPDMDMFIIVTDETTWADKEYIDSYKNIIPDNLKGKTILFNTHPSLGTVFKPSEDIVRIAGLNGQILSAIKAVANFDLFKQDIINQFNEACKSA